ncbi:MAG: argininosuccinate lyase [Candidatus Nitrosocaldaceae archaeon]|nr:MAG: argininosuccinate lyase [Candidatus Nitrosocaldaceae archaeon]
MYRSRLKGSLDKDALRYLSSIDEDQVLLEYDIIGSMAHVIMLKECNIIDNEDAKAILIALKQAKSDVIDRDSYEDIHEALEAYVIKHAKLEHGGKMHTGRSRNDQVALDLRLLIRDEINIISNELIALISSLINKANYTLDCIMPMYTHLQQAQIGLFSHYMLAYADMLLRDVERFDDCYKRINRSPLGASAIGGTSLPIDRRLTAELLAFDTLIENSIDATSNRDFMLEFCFILTNIMLNLSRMAEDLIIWSSNEFDYIELPDELTSTSSIMPQKKNPCPLELLRARTASVIGNLTSIISTIKSLPSGYNRDLQDTKRVLLDAIRVSKDSINIMRLIIEGLVAKKENMLDKASKSYALALDLAEMLVKKGMPFREAHKIVGSLVMLASNKKKSIKELTQEEVNNDEVYELLQILDVSVINSRVSIGAANPKEDIRMIDERRLIIDIHKKVINERVAKIEDAMKRLEEIANKIMNER